MTGRWTIAAAMMFAAATQPPPPAHATPPVTDARAGIALASATLGDYILLGWNDLGMHCMNQYHANFSVLPPYNNQYAQVIRRGSSGVKPQVVNSGIQVTYSIPGNTTSVGKTDFWTYAPALFGVTLPPDVGLTGKGLTGTLDPAGNYFHAEGIPITPFPDATPTVENAYQKALLIAHDATSGAELARSTPTIPVSVELSCIGSGCHSSESQILQGHPREAGFDPTQRPILCAKCHASPALGTAGIPEAKYFSFRIHDQHKFIDETIPGMDGCYKCHPGKSVKCLRGVMADKHNMVCQDCHGNMANVSNTIEQGRIPWVNEPACRTCHTSRYGEPAGQLYRKSAGHGGVMCEACHGSTHGEYPSRRPEDNASMIALQGHAGILSDCTVCHGVTPTGPGPHGTTVTAVADELLGGARRLSISPNPSRGACFVRIPAKDAGTGRLLVFDVQGRTVRLLETARDGASMTAAWDGRDAFGRRVKPGAYFIRWQQGSQSAAGRVMIVN